MTTAERQPKDHEERDRRGWFSLLGISSIAALGAAYGTLGAFMLRFLYPSGDAKRRWTYVVPASRLAQGESLVFSSPGGATINIARQGESDDSIVALSSTCPHLGCQVHWEADNDRFFCPCHNGIFDRSGVATGGPPAEAGQSLPRYPLKIENDLLFIELEDVDLAEGQGTSTVHSPEEFYPACPVGPGHDPCLHPVATNRPHERS